MTLQEAYTKIVQELCAIYENREAANITDLVFENVTGKKKIDRIIQKDLLIENENIHKLEDYLKQLLQHKPVQYVLNEAWFSGLKLYVDDAVLIPRPETEELVEWIAEDVRSKTANSKFKIQNSELNILDVGTGSGCIALALKKNMPYAEVAAIDVSAPALKVAKKNAADLNLDVSFFELNILDKRYWKNSGTFDIIVSNPPYVKRSEEYGMSTNVLNFEPHLALFVPDDAALIFYNAIAEFAQLHLKPGGKVYVEINAGLGKSVITLFKKYNFTNILLRKDLQGKDRMVSAQIAGTS